jgi:VWFA-related protein
MRFLTPVMLLLIPIMDAPSLLAQRPTFSVKTEEVRIDVLVTDNGRPVEGLRAEDFEVKDNGVPQVIESASYQEVPISTTLVLDMSGSVAGNLIGYLKSAGNELLNSLKEHERAALMTFSQSVTLDAPLTTEIPAIRAALDKIQPRLSGRTSLIDACYAGLIHAESKADRPLILVFSDGLDTSSWLTDEAVLESARRSDAIVYAVSAGRLPDRKFLRELTKITGGALIEMESTGDLGSVFVNILSEFRQRYLLTYSPEGVRKSGWHDLEVRVKKHRYDKISARPGYIKESAEGDAP